MFGDIGWTELLVIGVVALIVIGPEDLPEMFRQLGRFTAKIRSMAREFQRAMDQAARESGVNDVAKDLKAATSAKSLGITAVKDAADKFEKWDPLKSTKTSTKAAPAAPAAAATDPAPAAEEGKPAPEGPATKALREKQAARKAVIEEMGAKLKAVDAGDLTVVKPAAKTPGRIRSAATADAKATPKTTPKAAVKPAAKPAEKPPAKPRAKKATDA
ncbi:Sec-independent protein translocase protein TatB [Frigidibacter sp. RF13]|uniref:Sec-independent protein translocase protein TatB n=1 Tax=Frigidibacter sp. RF13 TaxID=2997340 RepID=UPI0022714E30|nr:Sec-independent protein translocase protein TatB [Frigidibacter sp. RF13]MCY1126272.1 Sec-independent protein translocase protein TatB [Frigidibacter sp. RF13]